MKLLVIWLFGVPLAVGGMCAASALWSRDASPVGVQAAGVLSLKSAPADKYFENVLAPVRE